MRRSYSQQGEVLLLLIMTVMSSFGGCHFSTGVLSPLHDKQKQGIKLSHTIINKKLCTGKQVITPSNAHTHTHKHTHNTDACMSEYAHAHTYSHKYPPLLPTPQATLPLTLRFGEFAGCFCLCFGHLQVSLQHLVFLLAKVIIHG